MSKQRESASMLRRWCPIAGTHQEADWLECGWSQCYDDGRDHRLRLRRMLICSECQQGYFNKKEFADHECYSAY